jgi:uncharacterized protein YkwD
MNNRPNPRRPLLQPSHRQHGGALTPALMLAGLLIAAPISSADGERLIELINDLRESPPASCEGRRHPAAGPLAPSRQLADMRLDERRDMQQALREVEYQASKAQVIGISGPGTAKGALKLISKRYCQVLLDPQFAEIGVHRRGNRWQLVLARPLIDEALGDWQSAGQEVLRRTNEARAQARRCGSRTYEAAPPLRWNEKLGNTALAHSRDMAHRNFFNHQGSDGSQVGQRARREGYDWLGVGENLAAGQGNPAQAISGWLASPGHCANLMDPRYTELGAAYATNPQSEAVIYWTQVFGVPD